MMKELVLILIMVACFVTSKSQAYIPLIDTNAVWKQCEIGYPPPPIIWYLHHWDHIIMDDTIINNTIYKAVGKIDYNVECSKIFTGPYYYAAIREDTIERKVYKYHPDGDELLYDFSLELGDTLRTSIGYGLVCIAHDTILVGDSYRKRWTYAYETYPEIDVVEGIGAYTGLLEYMVIFEHVFYLRCYYYTGESIYINPFFPISQCDLEIDTCLTTRIKELANDNKIKTLPNPFNTSTTLSYTLDKPSTVTITIFNPQGQLIEKIEQDQPKGEQKVQWNAEGLPAGMYYFRLQTGEQYGSGKMIKME